MVVQCSAINTWKTNALSKIKFMTNINLLHVLAHGCQPEGD